MKRFSRLCAVLALLALAFFWGLPIQAANVAYPVADGPDVEELINRTPAGGTLVVVTYPVAKGTWGDDGRWHSAGEPRFAEPTWDPEARCKVSYPAANGI